MNTNSPHALTMCRITRWFCAACNKLLYDPRPRKDYCDRDRPHNPIRIIEVHNSFCMDNPECRLRGFNRGLLTDYDLDLEDDGGRVARVNSRSPFPPSPRRDGPLPDQEYDELQPAEPSPYGRAGYSPSPGRGGYDLVPPHEPSGAYAGSKPAYGGQGGGLIERGEPSGGYGGYQPAYGGQGRGLIEPGEPSGGFGMLLPGYASGDGQQRWTDDDDDTLVWLKCRMEWNDRDIVEYMGPNFTNSRVSKHYFTVLNLPPGNAARACERLERLGELPVGLRRLREPRYQWAKNVDYTLSVLR